MGIDPAPSSTTISYTSKDTLLLPPINTPISTDVVRPSPLPTPAILTPLFCRCGYCLHSEKMDEVGYRGPNLDVCCVDSSPTPSADDVTPCQRPSFLSLLSGDIDATLYALCTGSFTHTTAPPTYASCTPA